MSEIKTITSLATETEIEFNDFWQFVWVKNIGDGDCYVSNKSGIEAGGVDVIAVKANETAMVITETQSIYSKGATTLEVHAQNFAECPFKRQGKGGASIDVTALSVTTNGVYTAPSGTAYSPVVVDVVEQPWEPLQDGYSNFWFELTNDTLSPWLNFSAKDADATIDWGDGSGEQTLDTLTPTHTYAKAGKYVVKCKGVTGIAAQNTAGDGRTGKYKSILTAVEANSEITALLTSAFGGCAGLEHCILPSVTVFPSSVFYACAKILDVSLSSAITYIPSSVFQYCVSLVSITLPSDLTQLGASCFQYTLSLSEITIPAGVTSISANCFNQATNLTSIHVLPTVPPTLSTNIFVGLPSDFVIYVPVGTLSAYQSAWSAYADHIVEEGSTLTRAQLRRIAEAEKKSEESEER